MREHNETDNYSGPEATETNAYLRERYGDGFMGFPLYRLVYSKYVTTLSAGEWNDWDSNLPVEERGKMVADESGKSLTPNTRAERVVTEMRRCPEYPELEDIPGWILQRWMAPAYWGNPVEWESRVVEGTSLPRLGPYPFQGKYMLIAGPYPEAPSGPYLDRIVEQWELMRDTVLAMETGAYVRKRWYEAEEAEKRRKDRWNAEASAANMTAMQPLFSTFLEGGKARQAAVERAGINSNYGN